MYRLARTSLRHPKTILAILGAITLGLGAGLPRVHSEYGYRVLIGDDHPSIVALDALIERFGGGFPIQIGWACGKGQPCASVFDRRSMEMAHAVQKELAPAAGVQRVVGPSSAALLVPSTGGFAVRRFVENGRFVSDAEALAARALDDPLWVGSLVSADGSAGVIVVQPVDTREETGVRVSEAIEAALRPHEATGFAFYLVGHPIENLIVGRDLAESTARLIPFTVLAIGLILLALSRSWQSAAVSLATMGVALLWTFGLLGWLDWPQDGILEVLAPVIMVVGVCDAVHLLSRYGAELAGAESSRQERSAALLRVTRELATPCLVTTLTTAAAFLSFATSDLATFFRFGWISAFGVVACLLLTFTLLPVLIEMLPPAGQRSVRASRAWDAVLDAILRASERRAVPLLLASSALLLVCAVGWLGYLRVDTDWRESLGEKSRVVQSMRFMEDRLGQSSSFEIELRLPPEAQLEDPATLAQIEQFSGFLSGLDQISTTTSIVDVIRRVNRLLHDDDPAFDRPGDTLEANAEILELIGFEDPDLRRSWISFDRSRVRLSATAPEHAVSTLGRVLSAIRRYAEDELPATWGLLISGEAAIQFDWIRDVQSTQVRSFPTALALVFILVAISLRSLRLAVAALIPTVLPIVVTLGTMGWIGMSLDVGRAMIAVVLLGIGVDDSIHILSHYQIQRRAGEGPRAAIRAALLHTGRAVVTTSLALSLGFLTLMGSAWQSIASFGFFVAIAILAALAAALFVLPALITVFARDDSG